MRPYLLIILFLAVFTKAASAQKIRFTDTANVWQVNIPYAAGGNCYQCRVQFQFSGSGATGGYLLLTSSDHADSALVREDTAAQKVYAVMLKSKWGPTDTIEELLYDFSLQAGDTFRMKAGVNGTDSFVHLVSGIDTVHVGGIAHQLFHFHALGQGDDYEVIEGIGCVKGPLHPYFPLSFEYVSELYCFRQGGYTPAVLPAPSMVTTFVYTTTGIHPISNPFENTNTCLLLGIEDHAGTSQLKIYPQPASGAVTIELPAGFHNGKLMLTNALGQVLLQDSFGKGRHIHLSNPGVAGACFLYLVSENGRSVRTKLVFN